MKTLKEWLGLLLILLLIAGGIWVVSSCQAAKASEELMPSPWENCVDYSWDGPFYRMTPEDQAAWEVGFSYYFNIVDGRHFSVPPLSQDEMFYVMVVYHSERMQNWLENWALSSGYPFPPPDAGLIIVTAALAQTPAQDFRHAAGALVCENWECFGLTGHDPYGMSRSYAGFAEATMDFFHNLTVTPGYYPYTPEQVSGNYNKWKWDSYIPNWCALFWSVI